MRSSVASFGKHALKGLGMATKTTLVNHNLKPQDKMLISLPSEARSKFGLRCDSIAIFVLGFGDIKICKY